jgi:hypothetical protein
LLSGLGRLQAADTDRRICVHLDATDERHRATTGDGRPAPPRDRRRGRHRRILALGTVLALVVTGGCAVEPEGEGAAAAATFERATGASFDIAEPVANPTDLVAPRPGGGDESDGDEEGDGGDAAEPAGEPVWTVVGSTYSPEGDATSATVWTSEDGREWAAETVAEGRPGRDVSIAAADRSPRGIIAVGRAGAGDESDGAVWLQDGDGWRGSTPDEMGGEDEQWAFDVAAGPQGMLVAGGEGVWGDVRPRLWFSPDGDSWTSVDGGAGGVFDATGEETVRAVTAAGDGFVAVGTRTLDNEQDGLVWYSPDGTEWEQVEAPTLAGSHRQDVLAVVGLDNGTVVAGGLSDTDGSGRGDPVIWRSEDGRTWGEQIGPLKMTDDRSDAYDLAVRSLSVSAAGTVVASGGNFWRPRVWRSNDGGAGWDELADPVHGDLFQDGVTLRDAAAHDGMYLAVGANPSVMMLSGERWEDVTSDAFPSGGAKPFVTSVADGPDVSIAAGGHLTVGRGETRESRAAQVWRRDEDRWATVDSELLSAGGVNDVTAFAGGFVAVGSEDFGLVAERGLLDKDPLPDGLVWVSPNGADWGRIGMVDTKINEQVLEFIEDPSTDGLESAIAQLEAETPPVSKAPAGGDGTQSLSGVAPLGDGYVAVGSSFRTGKGNGAADPIILVSSDGLSYEGKPAPHSGAGNQTYNDVCTDDDGRGVAVGVEGTSGTYDVIVATRTDAGWKAAEGPFDDPGDQQAYACAAGEDGFIVVGYDNHAGNSDARIWTSEDGQTWTEEVSALLGGSGDQRATAVASVPGGGWLVAGTDGARGDGDIVLWRIDADGELSRRDQGEPALGGPGEQTVRSVAVDPEGDVTLVGGDYGRVGVWESDSVDR